MPHNKKQLILDIAGVLVTNFSPRFWQTLSERTNTPYERLVLFKNEIRADFWSGKLSEDVFWIKLCERFPKIKRREAKTTLFTYIQPMPAINKIAAWSKYADIHLLSNHRAEWIQPMINPIQPYLCSVTISSVVGCCKPNTEIYTIVERQLDHQGDILFVDDQEINFQQAKVRGWNSLLADKNGEWVKTIQPFLTNEVT